MEITEGKGVYMILDCVCGGPNWVQVNITLHIFNKLIKIDRTRRVSLKMECG